MAITKMIKKTFTLFLLGISLLHKAQTPDSLSVAQKSLELEKDSIAYASDIEIVKTKIDLSNVFTKADEMPEFQGGMKQFRKRFFEHFKFTHRDKIKDIRLFFIVENTGYVKHYIALSPKDKYKKQTEDAMRKVFERWKPAKINNQPVRFLMFFPIVLDDYAVDIKEDESIDLQNISIDDIPDLEELKKIMNLKGVVSKADEMPEFPEGISAFKKKYFDNIETLNLKNNEKIDTHLYFIVEKNGYVRNVAAIGSNKKHNHEAELGISRIFDRWKPAKINGEPVRYLYYFPLTPKKY
ncbi:hypothetical protein CHRY9390_01366 [Chryseobacterium aquaeductus]|uniref:TonB C-terminal domain-containing protein n=1 Tax=Chryseobacterium aquaeductus TaxID=2675056 RepID=A0A9N8MFQ6_9FLAO|nr:hypothetical protein [Chryseobacterium aquaeductus]CAA7330695.1 hypothetical protein CHRY9390_01366 [Chryseobacterium potabilaquae]CAD7805437.1 hypothetical protein CHRY9390_01366 [Chryseobacterium aquaeductus]